MKAPGGNHVASSRSAQWWRGRQLAAAAIPVIAAGSAAVLLLVMRAGPVLPLQGTAVLRIGLALAVTAFVVSSTMRERELRRLAAASQTERARLLEVEHRLQDALAFDRAVRAVGAAVEHDHVAASVLAEAVGLLEADDGSLLLADGEGRLLVAAARHDQQAVGTVVPEPSLATWLAVHREPLLLTEGADGTELPGMLPEPLASAIGVPLVVGERLVGVLGVGTTDPARRFDAGDVRLLLRLAGHAASACSAAGRLAEQHEALVGLREADRRRADQLAMVTHDLKTPLTSLIGYVQLLRKRGDEVTTRERTGVYGHMDRQARRMLEMVEDLLISSRLEQGAQTLKREPLDLVAIVEELRGLFAGRAPDRRIEVVADPVPDVYGDRNAVAHVLQNLVDNALKYSPPTSTVWVSVEDQANQVLLTVRDQGDGIPQEELAGIFERFQQVAGSDQRGSVGLGLHVVKSLVVAHGGRAWCESRPGEGASFFFTLPRRAGQLAAQAAGLTEPAMR